MDFLKSDKAKIIGAVIASVTGTLVLYYPPPNRIGVVCAIVSSILVSLGLISGGISASQPKPLPPPPPAP